VKSLSVLPVIKNSYKTKEKHPKIAGKYQDDREEQF
jgi:hypothetical protein